MNTTETTVREAVIDADIPIIDAHHHLHDMGPMPAGSVLEGKEEMMGVNGRLLVDDYIEAVRDCNVTASVLIEAGGMYRSSGPDHLRSVGEVEFLNGQAAMAASGRYGACNVGAAIIGHGNLCAGDRVRETLEAQRAASLLRYRGVRHTAGWDEDTSIFNWLYSGVGAGLYRSDSFRAGFAVLDEMDLVFDAFVLAPQLDDVVDLAGRFPNARIVVEHLGNPLGIGRFEGRREEVFPEWRAMMAKLAEHENVTMKIGGLGNYMNGLPSFGQETPASSQQLADEWRPYVGTALELFGPSRCMFNSDLPTNRSGSFANISNAYKRLTADLSRDERMAIFSGTAARVYRIEGAGA